VYLVGWYKMGFISDIKRLMKVSTKPDKEEIWLVVRVTVIGMGVLGFLGYIIKLTTDVITNADKDNLGIYFVNLLVNMIK
jgi:protein translocase SEC61 complex gamma subunit